MDHNSKKRPHAPLPTSAAPRCGARTRRGTSCQNPRVRSEQGGYRPRCRLHGCGQGSGGQPGNQNALKHGHYTKEALAERRRAKAEIKEFQCLLDKVLDSSTGV